MALTPQQIANLILSLKKDLVKSNYHRYHQYLKILIDLFDQNKKALPVNKLINVFKRLTDCMVKNVNFFDSLVFYIDKKLYKHLTYILYQG